MALRSASLEYALPKSRLGRFSHKRPRICDDRTRRGLLSKRQIDSDRLANHMQISLPSIVSKYIVWLGSRKNEYAQQHSLDGEDSPDICFTGKELAFLQTKGYSSTDVKGWAAVLLCPDRHEAALKLFRLQTTAREETNRDVPIFLVRILFRRQPMMAATFKILLRHICERHDIFARDCLGHYDKHQAIPPTLFLEEWINHVTYRNAVLEKQANNRILIHSLIREALTVWPASVVDIVDLAIKLQEGESVMEGAKLDLALSDDQVAHLSKFYNGVLHQLSRPAAVDKYKSIVFQQRAQFNLLRHMAEHKPPLTVTKYGYRAIVRTQLAQKKTAQERDWASLKSQKWPPWKEDKTGLDADKGLEYGMSRAAMAIQKMQEAGYGTTTWDETAKIYAGWDTDGTPTIQTRFSLPPPANPQTNPESAEKKLQAQLWSARIRATRTVREAWGCFLACRNQAPEESSVGYIAMLQKLAYEEKRLQLDNPERHSHAIISGLGETHVIAEDKVLPGDGIEVFAPPTSPLDSIYLPSEPPSVDAFFDEMIRKGIPIPDTSLASLIEKSATSLEQAFSYILRSRPASEINSTFRIHQASISKLKIPSSVLVPVIQAHCRFSNELPYPMHVTSYRYYSIRGWHLTREPSLSFALNLLDTLQPKYKEPWIAVLDSLNEAKTYLPCGPAIPQAEAINRIISFQVARHIWSSIRSVGLDPRRRAFHVLLKVAQHAFLASLRLQAYYKDRQLNDDSHEPKMVTRALRAAKDVTTSGSTYVQSAFSVFVYGVERKLDDQTGNFGASPQSEVAASAPNPPLPRHLHTPALADLHVFVRILGLAKDYDALRNLTRWMVDHKVEFDIQIEEARNGRRQLRYAITALAVIFEQNALGLRSNAVISDEMEKAGAECRQSIEDAGESWGGWPTNEELEAYIAKRIDVNEWLQYL